MGSLVIHRSITVKARVTEEFKLRIAKELHEAIQQIEFETQKLEFQARRMLSQLEKQNPPQAQVFRQQLEFEKQKRVEKRESLLEKLKEIADLEVGSEVVQGSVEGPYEVRIGDDWNGLLNAEILLEDGKVVEIRGADGCRPASR